MSALAKMLQHPIVLVLMNILVLVLVLSLDRVIGGLEQQKVLIAAGVAGVIIVICVSLSALFFHAGRKHDLDEKLALVAQFLDGQGQGWIVNHQYVEAIEILSSHTWIFSREMVNDLDPTSAVHAAVSSNLRRGNKYTYFLPASPKSREIISTYSQLHTFKPGQVRFYLIPEEQFHFYTEVAIYNVDDVTKRSAVEWLPHEELNFYICMDQKRAQFVKGIGLQLMDQFEPYEIR